MAQRSSAGSYIEDSIKHGKQAFELLPLSPEPSLRLMLYENTFADTKKWFHESLARQIDSEQVIKAFYELASKSDDPQTAVADLMVSLSKSQRYDLKIPENVIVMLKRFKGKSDFGLICQNEEVQKALERVVKGGVKNGGDEKWLKEARQLQVEVGVKGGHFDRAFAVAKLLEGDLGSFNSYRGRPLTLSRMACLGNEFVESIEDKIDEGTVDLDSIFCCSSRSFSSNLEIGRSLQSPMTICCSGDSVIKKRWSRLKMACTCSRVSLTCAGDGPLNRLTFWKPTSSFRKKKPKRGIK